MRIGLGRESGPSTRDWLAMCNPVDGAIPMCGNIEISGFYALSDIAPQRGSNLSSPAKGQNLSIPAQAGQILSFLRCGWSQIKKNYPIPT